MSIQLSEELQKLTKSERGTTSPGHRPVFNIIIILTTEVEPFPLLCMYMYIYIKGICQSDLQAVFQLVKNCCLPTERIQELSSPGCWIFQLVFSINWDSKGLVPNYIAEVNLTARASR